MLEYYADQIQARGGKLVLAGINRKVLHQLEITETTEKIPLEDIFLAKDELGMSATNAIAAAQAWLGSFD